LRGDDTLLPALRKNLDTQWKAWEILAVTERLIRRAAELAGRYRLRGYDSLHFAAAESTFEVFRGRASFCFAVFDGQLSNAAKEAGIPLLDL
jgi:predicted nucleic acid-binding protein